MATAIKTKSIDGKFELNAPATMRIGSDSYAGYITGISASGQRVKFTHGVVKAAEGSNYYADQRWDVSMPADTEPGTWFSYRPSQRFRDARWAPVGDDRNSCYGLSSGHRHYMDPGF